MDDSQREIQPGRGRQPVRRWPGDVKGDARMGGREAEAEAEAEGQEEGGEEGGPTRTTGPG